MQMHRSITLAIHFHHSFPCFAVGIVALNSTYVKYVTRVQTFFTVVKMIPLIAIIIAGMVWLARGKIANMTNTFSYYCTISTHLLLTNNFVSYGYL